MQRAASNVFSQLFMQLNNKLIFNLLLQCGVIKSILKLIEIYSPIGFGHIWNEFNVLELCMSLLNQNYSTGIDLSCQCDLIHICASLLAGKISANNNKIDFRKKIIWLNLQERYQSKSVRLIKKQKR